MLVKCLLVYLYYRKNVCRLSLLLIIIMPPRKRAKKKVLLAKNNIPCQLLILVCFICCMILIKYTHIPFHHHHTRIFHLFKYENNYKALHFLCVTLMKVSFFVVPFIHTMSREGNDHYVFVAWCCGSL